MNKILKKNMDKENFFKSKFFKILGNITIILFAFIVAENGKECGLLIWSRRN